MNILPFGNNVLIEPISIETTFLTATNGMMTSKSRAVATGPDCKWVNVGDILICNYWAPNETKDGDKSLFFVKEDSESILAKYVVPEQPV